MKKLTLFIIAAFAIALLVPQSRAAILDLAAPLLDANRARSAERALERIAVDVQRAQARTGAYPPPADFASWMIDNEIGADDPWGSPYYIEILADSLVVGSPGPDLRSRTADDIRVTRRREATAAGMGSAFQPPAPPSSGVKSTALKKAKEAGKQ